MNKTEREDRKTESLKVIQKCWESYYEKTGKTSEVCRQFSYAGIAIVWILSSNDAGEISRSVWLLAATLGFVASLGFDFLQYFGSSIVWHIYCKCLEKKDKRDGLLKKGQTADGYDHPSQINLVAEIGFALKCLALIIGYFALGGHLFLAVASAV